MCSIINTDNYMFKQFEIIIGNCGITNKRNTRAITWKQTRDNLVHIFQRYKSLNVAQPGNLAI